MKITANTIGHIFLILLTGFFSFQIIVSPQHWIFLDNVNLLIHEAGHLVCFAFGQFIYILGGSLMQIIIPVLFFLYFFLRNEYVSAGFIIFWISNNIISVSVYMSDAVNMQLPLIGGEGVIHDWNWLFTNMGLLQYSESIGNIFFWIGIVGVFVSLIWMIFFMIIQKQGEETESSLL